MQDPRLTVFPPPHTAPHMYSRQYPFVPPHLCLMLDTCLGFLDNFCVSFHNRGNVRSQLTRKQRNESVALKLCSSFFFLVCSEDWIPRVEVLYFVFHVVLYPLSLSAPLLPRNPTFVVFDSKSKALSSYLPNALCFLGIFLLFQIFPGFLQVGF